MTKVLYLVGPHACGKTYSSLSYAKKVGDTAIIDTGPMMRSIHAKTCPDIPMGEWIKLLEQKNGLDISSKLISEQIKSDFERINYSKYIIIGFRSLRGIIFSAEYLGLDDYHILYLDGDSKLLYSNYLDREHNDLSFEEFCLLLHEEEKLGLIEMKKRALEGDETIKYFYRTSINDNIEEIINDTLTNNIVKKRTKE